MVASLARCLGESPLEAAGDAAGSGPLSTPTGTGLDPQSGSGLLGGMGGSLDQGAPGGGRAMLRFAATNRETRRSPVRSPRPSRPAPRHPRPRLQPAPSCSRPPLSLALHSCAGRWLLCCGAKRPRTVGCASRCPARWHDAVLRDSGPTFQRHPHWARAVEEASANRRDLLASLHAQSRSRTCLCHHAPEAFTCEQESRATRRGSRLAVW